MKQRAKCLDCERMPHDRPYHPVTAIFAVPQSIAVLDARIPAGNRALPRRDNVRYADVLAKDLAAPAVVVSRDPQNLHSRIAELGQRRKRAKASTWDNSLPLEPEIEQVAVYDERLRISVQSTEERYERSLDLRAGDAQVRVGNDIARGVEHGSMIARSSSGLKEKVNLELQRCEITEVWIRVAR